MSRADNLKNRYKVNAKNNAGMGWDEALNQFIRSRELGIYGAAKAVKPRTIEEYRWDLGLFTRFMFAEKKIASYNEMTEKDVMDYIEHIRTKGWSKATQRKYLISLKAFFRWVERDPACKSAQMVSYFKSMPRIGKEIHRTFVPSPEQIETFAKGFDQEDVWGLRDYTVLCLMLDTGARIGEICNLEYEDIKWDQSLVNLDGKTGERLVPFNKTHLQSLIENWMRVRAHYAHEDCKKVFISRFGGNCAPDLFRQSFSDNLKRTKLNQKLGKNTISCHTIRHYFCTMYLVNGGSLHNLQRITGHKDLNTLMIYVNLANQITTIKTEQAKASPLNGLMDALNGVKKRKLIRL